MMDFDIQIKMEGMSPGQFIYNKKPHQEPTVRIFIKQVWCNACDEGILTEGEIEHVLEHEIVEATVCDILVNDGIPHLHNAKGFNHVFSQQHTIHKKHNCTKAGAACVVFG